MDWTYTVGALRASPSALGFVIFLPQFWNCGPDVAANCWLFSVACLAIGPCCGLSRCLERVTLAGTFLSWTKYRISLHGWTENCLPGIFTRALATRRESCT